MTARVRYCSSRRSNIDDRAQKCTSSGQDNRVNCKYDRAFRISVKLIEIMILLQKVPLAVNKLNMDFRLR